MRTEGFVLAFVLMAATAAAGQAPVTGGNAVLDGKTLFTAQKCDVCHTVSAAGIKATSKIKAPDLSATPLRDAAVLGKYLRKTEPLGGKTHAKAFMGSDEEIGALIAWLQKQGKAAEKK